MTPMKLVDGKLEPLDEKDLEQQALDATEYVAFNEGPARRKAIDRERDRRISTGFTFGGKAIQLDDRSGLALSQLVLIATLVDGDWTSEWIATDNSRIPLTKASALQLGTSAISWMSRHIIAARNLKDMTPPPEDFTNDSYWE